MKKVALITGGAKRIGVEIARYLHKNNIDIALHYNTSDEEAKKIKQELEQNRKDSILLIKQNLLTCDLYDDIIFPILLHYGQIDYLINNASLFKPTKLYDTTKKEIDDIFYLNFTVPYLLCQKIHVTLQQTKGCIINIIDIHAERPQKTHSIYNSSKGALLTLTKALAREMAPYIRVNSISPGIMLWNENNQFSEKSKKRIIQNIALKRIGNPKDIATTVLFLIESNYITGQNISVDGGRLLNI